MRQVFGMRAGSSAFATSAAAFASGYDADALYDRDGIAQAIVDRPAEDAVAGGWTIDVEDGDGDGQDVLNEMDRLAAGPVLTDALRWVRKEGAAAVLVMARDGAILEQPMVPDRLDKIVALLAFPASAITPLPQVYDDPSLPNYGMPVGYEVSTGRGRPFVVHETRLIPFSGEPLSFATRNQGSLAWMGRSALESCWTDLDNYRTALALARAIMVRKQQAIHKMAGLGDMLIAGQENIVRDRLDLADTARNIFNGVAVDGNDDYRIEDTALGGITDIVRDYRAALLASARMHAAVLFGDDFKGLGTTGTGELNIYHGLLRTIQEHKLRPALERLCGLIWAQRGMPTAEPEKWRVVFAPLWSPSEQERAETRHRQAQAFETRANAVLALVGTLLAPEEGRDYLAREEEALGIEPGSAPPEMPDDDPGRGGATATGLREEPVVAPSSAPAETEGAG